ncbi:MAG TPA: ATP-binding cassette domain-containing protein [Trichocoleus sp.]|jgi:D-methionine transport system ATP-binding protein
MMGDVIRLEGVSLTAGVAAYYLLQDISFQVAQGDRVAIVGASGAGKTSLLRVLNRLSEVTAGRIYFAGQEIRQIPAVQLRQQITLVAQESKLLGMTVREAFAYPLTLRGMATSAIEQRLSFWMEQLHIPSEWLDRTEVQLSVGQRQLVAIGRALMIQPKVLLLDEPTSALDAGRAHHLLETLTHLAAEQQITLFMVNHQLDLARQFCTRLLAMHQGRLTHDLAADQVDWQELKHNLIQAETQEAEEWQ